MRAFKDLLREKHAMFTPLLALLPILLLNRYGLFHAGLSLSLSRIEALPEHVFAWITLLSCCPPDCLWDYKHHRVLGLACLAFVEFT
jgi:hypothetical protein